MTIRFPSPLRPGDRIGVTAPSSGVPHDLRPRLDFCVEHLRRNGYDVVVGDCMDGSGVVSAPAAARGAELTSMLTDPDIAAPGRDHGGELAVELFPHLDLTAIASADPTWLVGYSDLSTLMLALTTLTGIATLHGQNLMDTPYRVPAPLLPWLDVVTRPTGTSVSQGPSTRHRRTGFDSWQNDPSFIEYALDTAGTWRLLDPGAGELHASGRLIGGCIETVSVLAGTSYGDLTGFVRDHAPEGLLVYVEASEDGPTDIARHLWRMRLAGWFDAAAAILVGRTRAPDGDGFTQLDAVRSALGDLGLPVVLDVDCGHVPPHLALVNGALADLRVTPETTTLTQHLL